MVQLYSGRVHRNKKDQTADTYSNIDESQNHYVKWKNPDSTGCMIYNSIYMMSANSKTIGP